MFNSFWRHIFIPMNHQARLGDANKSAAKTASHDHMFFLIDRKVAISIILHLIIALLQ